MDDAMVTVPKRLFEIIEKVFMESVVGPSTPEPKAHEHRFIKTRKRHGLKVEYSTWKCSCGKEVQSS